MGTAFLNRIGCVSKPELNNYNTVIYPVVSNQIIKRGQFVVIKNGYANLATTSPFNGIALSNAIGASSVKVAVPK